ncbi:MAG TPA: hypothetical protein VF630_05390 [Hymenobacter sp.]|jgi:hypothetical protein
MLFPLLGLAFAFSTTFMASNATTLFRDAQRPKLGQRAFLVSYRPLGATGMGRESVMRHDGANRRWYVDHSCRREPDFVHPNPLISGLCRKEKFAPKLREGDVVAYVVNEGRKYRITAVLLVVRTVANHETAEQLYQSVGQQLPGNCMVKNNEPLALTFTGGRTGSVQAMKDCLKSGTEKEQQRTIRQWDRYYRGIVSTDKVTQAALTEPLYIELTAPPTVTASQLAEAFGNGPHGRPPGMQTPSLRHTVTQLNRLLSHVKLPTVAEMYSGLPSLSNQLIG